MLRFWSVVMVVLFITLASADPSYAQHFKGINTGAGASPLFKNSEALVDNTVNRTQYLSLGMGGLGAIGLGTLAFFGRFNWGWMMALVAGLVLISGSQYAITYFTGVDSTTTTND